MNFRVIFFVVVASVALIALFDRLRPEESAARAAPETAQAPAGSDQAPAISGGDKQERDPSVYTFRFSEGQRVEGPRIIRGRQGEQITLRVTSDRAQKLHLHGYDRVLDLHPGATTELHLALAHSGRFELELHDPHVQVGIIEVQPR